MRSHTLPENKKMGDILWVLVVMAYACGMVGWARLNATEIVRPPNVIWVANEAGTGTTANKLVKLTGAPSTGIVTTAGDTSGAVGICVSGCGAAAASARASIANWGNTSCVFDGATTAGHYFGISAGVAGSCTDAGAAYPAAGQILGRVLSTNGGAGTYAVVLFGPDIQASTPAPATPVYGAVVDASPIVWALASAAVANGIVTLDHATATRALNLTNPTNGGFYTLVVKQDATGGALMTLGVGCTWKVVNGGAGLIVLTAAANSIDILSFTYDGTNCYANVQVNFN